MTTTLPMLIPGAAAACAWLAYVVDWPLPVPEMSTASQERALPEAVQREPHFQGSSLPLSTPLLVKQTTAGAIRVAPTPVFVPAKPASPVLASWPARPQPSASNADPAERTVTSVPQPIPQAPAVAPPPAGRTPRFPAVSPAQPLASVVELELPRGVRMPLAFLESGEPISPKQASSLDRIAEDFLREILPSGAASPTSKPPSDKEWDDSAARADSRYRLLFGDQAFDAASRQAALESLAR